LSFFPPFSHLARHTDGAISAIVRLAEPIALTSIFPYAWALVKKFEVGDEKDASFYAGLLISSFALAEAMTGMYWGGLSDRIGRKPVLLIGCAGTMISMIAVGFAENIWTALIGRALGGFLNGNIGVIQTMVGELVKKPEHERESNFMLKYLDRVLIFGSPGILSNAIRLEHWNNYWSCHWRHIRRPSHFFP
jgi:MFS family permease